MIAFLKTIIYIPLYNILILILNIDWVDVGIATIILTALVKIVLYPLSKKATVTQLKMREKEPELTAIKNQYKDKQEQALKVMEFYRKNEINPFSGILTIFIQIPIIYSLYYIFFRSGLPQVDPNLLYSFVKAPESISMMFFGLWDVSQKSLILAILAAVSTYFQLHLSTTNQAAPKNQNNGPEDFARSLTNQMKYTMPLIVFFISWRISGAVALYWFVSNLLGMAQDAYIKRKLFKNKTS